MTPVERLAAAMRGDNAGLSYAIPAQRVLAAFPWLAAALDGDPRPLMEACGADCRDAHLPAHPENDAGLAIIVSLEAGEEVWVLPPADKETDRA